MAIGFPPEMERPPSHIAGFGENSVIPVGYSGGSGVG